MTFRVRVLCACVILLAAGGVCLLAQEAAPPAQPDAAVATKFNVPGTFYLGFHGGAAIPLGAFGVDLALGYSLAAEGSYRFSQNLSAALYVGLYAMQVAGGSTGIGAYAFSLDVRYDLPLNEMFFLYLQLGPTMYTGDFSAFGFGFNGGAGVGWIVLPDLALELTVDYNASFQMTDQYIKVRLGALFKM